MMRRRNNSNVCIKHINHILRGDNMKAKDVMYMALGAGAVLAYQKYNKPLMKAMKKEANMMVEKADDTIENMMN